MSALDEVRDEGRIIVETSVGDFSGNYVGHESAQGHEFVYLRNESDDESAPYRVTLVDIGTGETRAFVSMLDGSHETLASMVRVEGWTCLKDNENL